MNAKSGAAIDDDGITYATAVPLDAPDNFASAIAIDEKNDSVPMPVATLLPSKPLSDGARRELADQGFPRGLIDTFDEQANAFALRLWIVDNSGSMNKPDGTRLHMGTSGNEFRMVECSRWEEIRDCVVYHARLAASVGQVPTRFRFLNDPQIRGVPTGFSVAENGAESVERIEEIMRMAKPGGTTPLAKHVHDICNEIRVLEPQLRQQKRRVAVIIATDGLPTEDGSGHSTDLARSEFANALCELGKLPVWIVIRLCTDESDVVEYYNSIDENLEFGIEILDDFVDESKEVRGVNPWFNYCLPLHRLREAGFHERVMDFLDERPLGKSEMAEFCGLIFGKDSVATLPDPSLHFDEFIKKLERIVSSESPQWNPVKRKPQPWINTKKLSRANGKGASCVVM